VDRAGVGGVEGCGRLAIAFLLCGALWGQKFEATTTLARVEVRAVDSSLKPLLGLEAGDVEVRENNVVRPVRSVSRDELPLDLFLIVDVSSSMHRHIAAVAKQAHQALGALKPGDRVALMSFNSKSQMWMELNEKPAEIEAAIGELVQKKNFRGGTVINTPIYEAAKKLRVESPKANRRAILILTDGNGFKGTRSSKVLEEMWEGDVTLNALVMPQSKILKGIAIYQRAGAPYLAAIEASVSDLVKKTSGELMEMKETNQALVEILGRIRSRYTVYYDPLGAEVKDRKVMVGLSEAGKARHAKASVVGRRQYSVR
jgi:Mg-chelatase subunit ChlD